MTRVSEQHFTVSVDEQGMRLDRLVGQRLIEVGRKLAGVLCETGLVRADGRVRRKSFLVQEGMQIVVEGSLFGRALAAPEISLSLSLVTEHLVIVDKPAGLPCGALPGREAGTVAGGLLAQFPEMAEVGFGKREPGILHRLDRETSGLLLAARDQTTFDLLRDALTEGRLEKRYLAVVRAGLLPKSGTVTVSLEHDSADRRRVRATREGSGRQCVSHFSISEEKNGYCLVEVSANRAFRHQVRAHLAYLGAPLIGDTLYGGEAGLSTRHALHASYIACTGDTFESFSAASKLPADLRALLDGADSVCES